MIDFSYPNENYKNDLMELVRLFEDVCDRDFSLDVNSETADGEMVIKLTSDFLDGFSKTYRFPFEADNAEDIKRLEKRYLKMAIYGTLVFLTGINLPYGCLTGIRPTKLYVELSERAHDMFQHDFSVRGDKLELIEKIVKVQAPLRNTDENFMDVFVFIPFCPSKCAYCSFVSTPIDKQKKLLAPYVDCLVQELQFLKDYVKRKGIKIRAVYIGGGTPTALPLDLLEKVLEACKFKAKEFTVEAGRPETITEDVITLLKKHKVTRISVNPQSFNDKTLKLIGRKHTAQDVEDAFKLVKGKFVVNMDLIAMLPEESFEDFKFSVDKAIALSPENITVHTLYLKKGSSLKNDGHKHTSRETAEQMVEYACHTLTKAGYQPYYMYRQKYTGGSLENVGYAKPKKECVYNIDIMEEDTSILAAGAAAISKKYTRSKNLIERNANFKEPLEYVKNFDDVMQKAKEFWQ